MSSTRCSDDSIASPENAGATADGRAPLRNDQALDGFDDFLTKTIGRVSTEMSLHVLAHNLKRVMRVLGITETMKAMRLAGA